MDLEVEEPFPAWMWPQVWTWTRPFRDRIADDFGAKTLDEFVLHAAAVARQARTFAVKRDGEIGGLVTVQTVSPVLATSHVLFRKSFWGRDTTVSAIQQAYAKAFESGIERIESFVFRDNSSIRQIARLVGAREEGILRRRTQRNGELVDMVVLGLLKGDFEQCLFSATSQAE